MDDEVIRLECLKQANGDVTQAAKLFDFVKRRGEFSAFNGTITQLRDPVLENEHVRVVGKDGDLPDYVKDKL